MMTSPKEKYQQISDSDILLIKGGWLVDKSNRPLSINRTEGERILPPSPPHDYEGQKYPMTNRVNTICFLPRMHSSIYLT